MRSAPAIKTISHSGRQLFYSCPRKFQLSKTKTFYYEQRESTKALSFGKAFGTGIQSIMSGRSLEDSMILAALDFDAVVAFDKDAEKSNESLAHVHEAIQSFYHGQLPGLSNEWKVLDMPGGLGGVELGFAIAYPDGTIERGFIDLILQNKSSGEVIILEIKTSGAIQVSEDSKWINSPQGIMYLLVLDYLLGRRGVLLNNRVLYLEYNKRHKQYTIFPFEKTIPERIDFLTSCWYDVEMRTKVLSRETKAFKTGNCTSYNRQCQYFGICDLDIALDYPEVEISPDLHFIEFQNLLAFYEEKLHGELRAS